VENELKAANIWKNRKGKGEKFKNYTKGHVPNV